MAKAAKTRTHTLVVVAKFNKPCTKAHALRELRNCVSGNLYYPTEIPEGAPTELRGSFRRREELA